MAKCMLSVDRMDFSKDLSQGYNDNPHSIGNVANIEFISLAPLCNPLLKGYGVTISAPHMHAHALELLLPFMKKPNARILDVGSGSGYLCVCMARIAGEGGKVGWLINHGDSIVQRLIGCWY